MINNFDKSNTNRNSELQRDLEAAFAAVAQKHNIDIHIGSGTYNAAQLSVKLVMRTKNVDIANNANNFGLRRLGLPENAIGRSFLYKNVLHTVKGINLKKRKYPVETTKPDGQIVNFTAGTIANILVGIGQGG
jgi:hypothetical protein